MRWQIKVGRRFWRLQLTRPDIVAPNKAGRKFVPELYDSGTSGSIRFPVIASGMVTARQQ